MRRWLGFFASWAFLVLGLGVCAIAIAGETINVREARRLQRFELVDELIQKKLGGNLESLTAESEKQQAGIATLESKVAQAGRALQDLDDTDQTILVSTAENKVYVRRDGQVIFEAICSTGKGTTLVDRGRTMVFETPTGKFRILSKEENPVWVPPDWHYIEEGRKNGLRVVRLNRGETLDAATGAPAAPKRETGVWGWFGENDTSPRTLRVKGDTVVEERGGIERELPPGEVIRAGDAIVIPPIGVKQRKFDKVLGSYRLNLGDGYALHGTQQTSQLGRSVSHGCVRLGDADIARLYQMANVGDEVIIY